jgi:protein ImuA
MSSSPMPLRAAAGNGFAGPGPAASVLRSPARLTLADQEERDEARALVARLRETVERMDGSAHRLLPESRRFGRVRAERPLWAFGIPEVDRHLPERGLNPFALHDVAPQRVGDAPAAMGFALALARLGFASQSKRKPVLWCRIETEQRENGRLYGHGLDQLGLPRRFFLTLTVRQPKALLWVMEEALKSQCLSVVIADAAAQQMNLTASRRLALAAAEGKASGVLVFNRNYLNATASASRWCIATLPSLSLPYDAKAPGLPAWEVALTRIRGGRPGQWPLAWNPPSTSSLSHNHDDTPPHFSLVPGPSGGALHPGAPEAQETRGPAELTLRAG